MMVLKYIFPFGGNMNLIKILENLMMKNPELLVRL
jgi:hypothetical protein